MTQAIRFRIGTTWLCVEDGGGCTPGRPDYVTVALRANRSGDRPGRRIAANRSTQRNEILALGLRLLELADRMPADSGLTTVCADGAPAKPPVQWNFGPEEQELIERLSIGSPIDYARHVYDSAGKLQARMPILRAAQTVLENCDDDTARGLHTILAATDMLGGLPVRPYLVLLDESPAVTRKSDSDGAATH